MERGTAAPNFWPMFIVAKRSPISATAELLLSVYVPEPQITKKTKTSSTKGQVY